MIYKLLTVFGAILLFVLQICVFPYLSLGGITPNLIIIYIAVIGFMHGEHSGLLIGFFCGLLFDIFFGSFLGFYALLLMIIGFINGKFYGLFYPEDIKLPIFLIITSDLSYGLCNYIFLFLLKGHFRFGFYLTNIILPEMLYTIMSAIIVYPVLLKISLLIETKKRKRDQHFV